MEKSSSQGGVLYRIRWRGQISGPFALDQVVQLVRGGKLSRHHEISTDGRNWRTVEQSGLMGQPVILSRPTEAEPAETAARQPSSGGLPDLELSHKGGAPESTNGRLAGAHSFIAPDARDMSPHSPLTLSSKRGLALVVIGVTPLGISFFQMLLGLSFAQVAWLFSAYFCVMWGWIIGLLAAWRSEVWKKGLLCSVFTCFIGIAMLLIWQNIPWIAEIYSGTENENPAMRLVGWIAGVGVLEELCKAAPLLLFCLGPGIIRSRGDGLLLGLLSGLGFAVNEGVDYTMRYWSAAVGIGAESIQKCVEAASNWSGAVDQAAFADRLKEMLPQVFEQYGEVVTAQLIRFMTLPLLHAAWAALVGYSIALSLIRRRWSIMWGGLGAAAILHGCYDFFGGSIYSVGIAGLSLAIPMLLYAREHSYAEREKYG